MDWKRVYLRCSATVVREGLCAVSVPVVPGQCSANSTGVPIKAVFSGFEAALQPGVAPGGVAAAAGQLANAQKQSTTVRFVVDSWFSYDITGLADDAGAAPDHRLSLKEQNDPSMTIDLALVRNLAIQANVTGTGISNREVAARHVFQRVKPAPTVTIRGLEDRGPAPASVDHPIPG